MSKHLHPKIQFLLETLAKEQNKDDGWVKTGDISLNDVPYHLRSAAQNEGYVEVRGKTSQREFRISAKGLALIGQQPADKPEVITDADRLKLIAESQARATARRAQINPVPPLSVPSIESGPAIMPAPQPPQAEAADVSEEFTTVFSERIVEQIRQAKSEIAAKEPDCAEGHCDTCVYRDVVSILEKRVPGVRELVNGLQSINRINK